MIQQMMKIVEDLNKGFIHEIYKLAGKNRTGLYVPFDAAN